MPGDLNEPRYIDAVEMADQGAGKVETATSEKVDVPFLLVRAGCVGDDRRACRFSREGRRTKYSLHGIGRCIGVGSDLDDARAHVGAVDSDFDLAGHVLAQFFGRCFASHGWQWIPVETGGAHHRHSRGFADAPQRRDITPGAQHAEIHNHAQSVLCGSLAQVVDDIGFLGRPDHDCRQPAAEIDLQVLVHEHRPACRGNVSKDSSDHSTTGQLNGPPELNSDISLTNSDPSCSAMRPGPTLSVES